MDGALTPTPKAGSGGKTVLSVPAGIDAGAAATTSARGSRKKATLPGGAAAAAVVPAAATAAPAAVSGGGGEEEDDEQVERFYALLANIRAMRGAYVPGSGSGTGALDDGVVDTGGGGAGARVKRLRGSEPPWRPAFRMEDFEEPTPPPPPTSSSSDAAPCAKRTRGQEDADGEEIGGDRPDVAARPRS